MASDDISDMVRRAREEKLEKRKKEAEERAAAWRRRLFGPPPEELRRNAILERERAEKAKARHEREMESYKDLFDLTGRFYEWAMDNHVRTQRRIKGLSRGWVLLSVTVWTGKRTVTGPRAEGYASETWEEDVTKEVILAQLKNGNLIRDKGIVTATFDYHPYRIFSPPGSPRVTVTGHMLNELHEPRKHLDTIKQNIARIVADSPYDW
jgi:hypothetical protein